MIEKIVDFWYSIPRDQEWWFEQIGRVIGGCSTGCFTFFAFWLVSTLFTTTVCVLFFARNVNEGISMGLAWGCPLGLTSALVGGSLTLAAIARYREG